MRKCKFYATFVYLILFLFYTYTKGTILNLDAYSFNLMVLKLVNNCVRGGTH